MKIILQDDKQFSLRFDKGEEVLAGLADFMKGQGIKACSFYGIGASLETSLSFFNLSAKSYDTKVFTEELEVVSLSGNGSLKGGQPIVHAHGLFGRPDFSVLGGHVSGLVVSVTCEIFLTRINGEMKREMNSDLNLSLLV